MNTDIKTATEHIARLINAYHLRGKNAPVEGLIEMRIKLSTLVFYVAGVEADAYEDFVTAEYNRKSKFIESKEYYVKSGESVAKAETLAEAAIIAERKAETQADAIHKRLQLIRLAAKEVLDCLNQHISNIKSEKRLEMTGQGSQHFPAT